MSAAGFPDLPGPSLGVGFDLPWGGEVGFQPGNRVAPRLARFLAGGHFSHVFFSWQARSRARLRLEDYLPAWDHLCAHVPAGTVRALHHTALNLGTTEGYERGALLDFTAALCERYQLRWINEDLGLWSLGGKPLPYPLPPFLTRIGLAAAIRNVEACQRALPVPLLVEFPGFAEGVSLVIGDLDAYDYFRVLAEETGVAVTLDVGHLLSWRWLRGLPLLGDLERLPLERCFELHLSGCEIVGDRFIDAHHGELLDAQLALCSLLISACPNLRAITYEDPRLDAAGALVPSNRASLDRLEKVVATWKTR